MTGWQKKRENLRKAQKQSATEFVTKINIINRLH